MIQLDNKLNIKFLQNLKSHLQSINYYKKAVNPVVSEVNQPLKILVQEIINNYNNIIPNIIKRIFFLIKILIKKKIILILTIIIIIIQLLMKKVNKNVIFKFKIYENALKNN